ncbi:hypothetical protein BJV78DRAFT_146776 [Lactifluus subvellereus]|nr:hypothetical protein BJV78DRAFT_146776 [Lactifluus subvellereus]
MSDTTTSPGPLEQASGSTESCPLTHGTTSSGTLSSACSAVLACPSCMAPQKPTPLSVGDQPLLKANDWGVARELSVHLDHLHRAPETFSMTPASETLTRTMQTASSPRMIATLSSFHGPLMPSDDGPHVLRSPMSWNRNPTSSTITSWPPSKTDASCNSRQKPSSATHLGQRRDEGARCLS